MNFVVHHQCYKNKKATEFAIKSFRQFNPLDPYVLWSDNGYDYSDFAKEYGVDFIFSDFNIGAHVYRGKQQVFEFFDRVRKTCEMYPDKPYVMWMEDDVLVKGKINIPEGVDFCGWPDVGNSLVNPHISIEKFKSLCEKYSVNPNFDYWTAAGGIMMSSDVFTSKFHILEQYIEEDYENLARIFTEKLDYDIQFMMAHLVCDKKYSIWSQITEMHRNSNWTSDQYAVVHGYKEHY